MLKVQLNDTVILNSAKHKKMFGLLCSVLKVIS